MGECNGTLRNLRNEMRKAHATGYLANVFGGSCGNRCSTSWSKCYERRVRVPMTDRRLKLNFSAETSSLDAAWAADQSGMAPRGQGTHGGAVRQGGREAVRQGGRQAGRQASRQAVRQAGSRRADRTWTARGAFAAQDAYRMLNIKAARGQQRSDVVRGVCLRHLAWKSHLR
ncbi:uncharacterized protein LOC143213455 [Lasioglossum baleicum]|uniref:uncharacterized protein LOC143213455 n=1 Tax=Lasioglossum baleicum TaxID=434251 RepID=UPI003FCD72CA